MGVIFDLDQTLIDSKVAKNLRKNRDWTSVYGSIADFNLYDGILEILNFVNEMDIEVAIVTSSPSMYCKKVVEFHDINIDNRICYHDTSNHKPHPDPIKKAIESFESDFILSFGDDSKDIIASKEAGVFSVACLWDADDKDTLLETNPDYICNNVQEAFNLIKTRLNDLKA